MNGFVTRDRLTTAHVCQWCGEKFFPRKESAQLYCSERCSARSNSARLRRLREAESAAIAGTITPDELFVQLAQPRKKPQVWEPETEAQR